jgi:hypothetical protein
MRANMHIGASRAMRHLRYRVIISISQSMQGFGKLLNGVSATVSVWQYNLER